MSNKQQHLHKIEAIAIKLKDMHKADKELFLLYADELITEYISCLYTEVHGLDTNEIMRRASVDLLESSKKRINYQPVEGIIEEIITDLAKNLEIMADPLADVQYLTK